MTVGELYDYYFAIEKADMCYESKGEFIKDCYCFLDMILSIACSFKYIDREEEEALTIENMHLRGIAITASEVIGALQESSRYIIHEEPFAEIKKVILAGADHIKKRASITKKEILPACINLLEHLNCTEFQKFLILLGYSNYYDTKYEVIYPFLQGDVRMKLPSLRMAVSLYELFAMVSEEEIGQAAMGEGKLFDVLFEKSEVYENVRLTQAFTLKMSAYTWMTGTKSVEDALKEIITWFEPEEELEELVIREAEEEKIVRILEDSIRQKTKCQIINLHGEKGNGRKFLLKHAAKKLKKGILFVHSRRLEELETKEQKSTLMAIYAQAVLWNCIVCFEDSQKLSDKIITVLKERLSLILWISEEKSEYLLRDDIFYFDMEVSALSIRERIQVWSTVSKEYHVEDNVNLVLLANQFLLSYRGIEEAFRYAEQIRSCEGKEKLAESHLKKAVKKQSLSQFGSIAKLIPAIYTWDDLILNDESKKQLKMISDQMKYKNVVGEEWGFYEKTAYGRGLCALLYGTPGTGKTMAAQVLANDLGLNLYRIDLSQMVSKYIGETEKNISKLFEQAKGINALLFFDEADSLFAKRCEVRDSMDRSANAQTAHLLQEIEQYDGVIVLATNYVNNIDDAFKRRIKFMVKFTFPTEEERLALWKTILPSQVPVEEELDFAFFANKFELTGSSIKEILTTAAYLAAAKQRSLANEHIVEAIKLNYAKYGKTLSERELEDFS